MCERYDITIRKFRTSDLDIVRGLIQSTIDVCYSDVYPKEVVRYFKDWHSDESILKDSEEGCIIVLKSNSKIIGTGTVVGDEIKRVFVEPAFQKNGFGKKLMQKLEEKALLAGIGIVKLDATLPSKKFYDSLGYVTLEATFVELENGKKLDYCKIEKSLIRK